MNAGKSPFPDAIPSGWRMRMIVVALAATAVLIGFALREPRSVPPQAAVVAAFDRTVLTIDPGSPVAPVGLVTQDGQPFAAQGARGRWTLAFFGFTGCSSVCPRTLAVLSEVARNPASGVAAGMTQIVFVSIDPLQDSPERLRQYLSHFDPHIVGLTGSREAVARYARGVGVGSRPAGDGIDHSTSLFVLDADARVVGVLLRPEDPTRIVADLAELKRTIGGPRRLAGNE